VGGTEIGGSGDHRAERLDSGPIDKRDDFLCDFLAGFLLKEVIRALGSGSCKLMT
jgi:hypothetical protein